LEEKFFRTGFFSRHTGRLHGSFVKKARVYPPNGSKYSDMALQEVSEGITPSLKQEFN
jgi:hypothetical protein